MIKIAMWFQLMLLLLLSIIGQCSVAWSFQPSPAYQLLSPYRAGSSGSLLYVAKHFSRIYGQTSVALGGLQPIRPRLGIPAFVAHHGFLHIEYLGRMSDFLVLRRGASFRLISANQQNCREGKCHELGPITHLGITKQYGDIGLATVVVKIPATVPPGFYDLIHQIPHPQKGTTAETRPTSLPVSSGTKTLWPASFFDVGPSPFGSSIPSTMLQPLSKPSTVAKEFLSKRIRRAVVILHQPPEQVESFSFVHLTDFHLRHGEQKRLHLVLDYLNVLKPRPDFILLTGDIVEYGNRRELWKQCIQALLRLQIPIFVMIGNHDYYRVHWGQPAPIPGLLREEEGLHEFVRAFHPFLAYRFRFGGYHWLSVDTGSSATNRTWFELKWVTLQGLGTQQLADIQSFLATPARYGHVLFAHGSPRAHVRDDNNGCDMGRHGVFLMYRREFEKALLASYARKPRPLIFLHGHTHWNAMYGRVVHGESCRFLRITERYPMMGGLPCWTGMPIWRSPLLISTQAATKHQPLRSGGVLEPGLRFGQGAGAAYGFRLIRVQQKQWQQALYRFYYRTTMLARKHTDGYIDPQASNAAQLQTCPP